MDMRASVITRIALVACLLLTACGGSNKARSGADTATLAAKAEALAPEKGQVWQLVAVRGKAVSRTAGLTTLTFNPEAGTISGKTACNTYYGSYRLRLEASTAEGYRYALAFSDIGSGDTRCPEADMNSEARYMALLPKADAMCVDAYTMTLYQRGKEILKYELQ